MILTQITFVPEFEQKKTIFLNSVHFKFKKKKILGRICIIYPGTNT